jgi:hypothetical protein
MFSWARSRSYHMSGAFAKRLSFGLDSRIRLTCRDVRPCRGSHKDDVLRLQGTPKDISRYPSLGFEVWSYGNSTVKISLASNTVVEYSNSGQLKISVTETPAKRPIMYHHESGDVRLYYDEKMAYSGVLSFTDTELGMVYGITNEGLMRFFSNDLQPLNLFAYSNENNELIVNCIDNSYPETYLSSFESRLNMVDISGGISASGTAMSFGNMTFSDLISDSGAMVYGTSIDFGDIGFDDFYSSTGVSVSGSRINIGNISFGDWYSSDGTSISGTSQQIESMVFHDYISSDGTIYTGTTMEIGDFSFTEITEW